MKIEQNLIFENTSYNVYYASQSNILVIEANGVINLNTTKEAWQKALEVAIEHKIAKWISDEVAVSVYSIEANQWWAKEWYPLASQKLNFKSKRFFATILSTKFYAEMSTKLAINNTIKQDEIIATKNKYIEHLYFENFDKAQEWLVNSNTVE